jgi:hypothetical protein
MDQVSFNHWADGAHEEGTDALEITCTERIAGNAEETTNTPGFTLHELAHAYHDRVLPGGRSELARNTSENNGNRGGGLFA